MLHDHRKIVDPVVLVLGSQTGALFRSQDFYEKLTLAHQKALQPLPPDKQFLSLYSMLQLNERNLSEMQIHRMLHAAFKPEKLFLSQADKICAKIIKDGYFREIIYTSIDDIIERSLIDAKLQERHDFEVFIAGHSENYERRKFSYRISKVFGDFLSLNYQIIPKENYFQAQSELEAYLQRLLSSDILAVGLDVDWDREFIRLLHEAKGEIYFVTTEESIARLATLTTLVQKDTISFITDFQNTHEQFWPILFHSFEQKTTTSLPQNIPDLSSPSSFRGKENSAEFFIDNQKKPVFSPGHIHTSSEDEPDQYTLTPSIEATPDHRAVNIYYIYATADLEIMEQLWAHLSNLRRSGKIREWHRGMLEPGAKIREEQLWHLEQAEIIIIGISTDFFSNWDYTEMGLYALNMQTLKKAVQVIPLLLRPYSEWLLTQFGTLHPLPSGPLSLKEMTDARCEEALVDIAGQLRKMVERIRKKKK